MVVSVVLSVVMGVIVGVTNTYLCTVHLFTLRMFVCCGPPGMVSSVCVLWAS